MKKAPNLKGLIFLAILALLLLTFAVLVTTAAQGSVIESEPVVVIETPCPTVPPTPEPTPPQKPWTDEEVIALAKMLYGEARGIRSDMEKAACIWCVLNRCDNFDQTVIEVITAPNQFDGYDISHPIDEDLYGLCEDVLARWVAEKNGMVNVGRVLPEDYLWFHGDGKHNYFRNEYKGGITYTWTLPNPYNT